MNQQRREAGFLTALGKSSLASLFWPEGAVAAVVGIGGGLALLNSTGPVERVVFVGDGLAVLGVLVGVVFAAFALLIAFFSDDYLRALDSVDGGAVAFMRPFMIAVGLQVTTLFVALGYRVSATDLDSKLEVGVFLTWSFLFSYVLLDVVALARTVTMHGLARARQLRAQASTDEVVHMDPTAATRRDRRR